MIVVRNVFQVKFGKAREATALLKQGVAAQQKALAGVEYSSRILTDVTGPFYTLVLEMSFPSLAVYEANAPKGMSDKEFQTHYQQLSALVESGHREIYKVVE